MSPAFYQRSERLQQAKSFVQRHVTGTEPIQVQNPSSYHPIYCSQDSPKTTHPLTFQNLPGSFRWSFTHTAVNSRVPGQSRGFHNTGCHHSRCHHQQPLLPELHSGKNVFPLSNCRSILKTAHTPHPALQVIWFLQFHNHGSHTKKNMSSFSRQNIIILLLSVCHVTLFCLISAPL